MYGKSFSNYITIFAVILFVLVSGASPSVVRAGIMAVILILSEVLARQPNTISTVASTALIILLYNPFIICDIGFILSFGGTIGIILLNKPITDMIVNKFYLIKDNRFFKYILEMLSVTLSAQIILTPVMWYYFNTVSLISIMTNLLVGPFTGIITICGLVIYFTSLIFKPLAQLISYMAYMLISIIIYISKMCSEIPYGNLILPTPSILFIVSYYLVIYLIFKKKNKFIGDHTNFLKRKIISIIVSVLIIMQIASILIPRNYIEVNTIDVGQGDSTLIKTNNYNILIDGGGSENSDYDVGSAILVPYLLDNTNGIIDLMIISHFHEDHAEGCIAVLEELKVGKIIIGSQPKKTELYDKVLQLAKAKEIPIITVTKGDSVSMDGLKFEILYPAEALQIQEDLNNNSLVIRMEYCNISMIFTGDIEKEAEEILLNEDFQKLDVDILKVAHHGSKSSSIVEFLEKVTPKISLISVGIDNKFNHPNDEVIQRLRNVGSIIYRTDECGEISFKIFNDGKITVKTSL